MSTKSNKDRFNEIFNKIDEQVKYLTNSSEDVPFSDALYKLSKSNMIAKKYYDDLNKYRKLRNTIIHATSQKFMAEPYDITIENMEHIYEMLKNPPKIIEKCNEVKQKYGSNDRVLSALRYMHLNDFSQVPIVDSNKIVGLLSLETIARWVDESIKESSNIRDIEIRKVLLQNENNSDYILVKSDTTIFEVVDIFERKLQEGKPLKAIFVTNYAKETDRLLGIVTPYDILKLQKAFY